MPRSKTPIVSLEEAKARFEEWRNKGRGKARIPAELWSVAVEGARKEGINSTARELHVAWDDLKRRMPATGAVPQQTAFVELVTLQVKSVPECTLEVEGRRGKLRIQLKGASASDLASLSWVLWEVASWPPSEQFTSNHGQDFSHHGANSSPRVTLLSGVGT